MDKSLIQIFRGDDTDGLGYQSIQGKITTTLDLTGCRAVFRYLGFTQEFDPIPENGRITITMPASATSKFPPGLGYASLRVYDSRNKVRTFTNRIPVFVTVYAPSECGGEFEVVFNGGSLELEPLKIKSVNGYRIYDGYLEQIIDKATAIEYGLALLFDSGDSQKDGNSGYAATPKAVQAAYDAIIQELTDNYYNAEETEEAIDRIAAYYITADAQGNPFATHAALIGATEFYSGGQRRIPTRNDYCVVLADETHDGRQYRYIYATNQQGVGQWEAQYAVGGSVELDNTVTRTSGNGVKSSGIWSAIWGALTALPTGFSSLYDWCAAQLAGKAPATNIAKSALASDVQASLGKADTALQTAPVTSVNNKTGAVSLSASDVGALGNTGVQTINQGGLTIATSSPFGVAAFEIVSSSHKVGISPDRLLLTYSGQSFDQLLQFKNGTLALLSDMYAAVQQIAPDFTAKAYVLNELCTFNGMVYRCKLGYIATASSAKPPNDTTHWEAKKVSELFLPRTGGKMTGELALENRLILRGASNVTGFGLEITRFAGEDAGGWRFYEDSDYGLTMVLGGAWNYVIFRRRAADSTSDTVSYLYDLAPEYSTSKTYEIGSLVVRTEFVAGVDNEFYYKSTLYRCTTAIATAEAWTAAHWTEATVEDVLAAIRSALDSKAPLASPAFTGTPTAPTPTAGDDSTKVATTAFVKTAVAGVPLRYDMPTAVALVADNDEATLVCADRAVTNATIADGFSTLNLTFPTAVGGKVRDFYLRITVAAGESAPALSIPQGITIENPDGAVPEIADGETSAASTTIVWFSETAPNVFTAKSETVKAVA